MDIGHVRAGEDARNRLLDLVGGLDGSGAIDDAVVRSVSFDQIIGRGGQNLGQGITACVPFALMGTQKDRPCLGIGVESVKGAMGQDQHRRAFGDIAQAMTAGIARTC